MTGTSDRLAVSRRWKIRSDAAERPSRRRLNSVPTMSTAINGIPTHHVRPDRPPTTPGSAVWPGEETADSGAGTAGSVVAVDAAVEPAHSATGAMNRYPRRPTVSTKRGESAESPRASRKRWIAALRL
jgi:hypothetical protein